MTDGAVRVTLPVDEARALSARLDPADADLARRHPGDPGTRQPVHTVYVPAPRFSAATARAHGDEALRALAAHAPDPAALAAATGMTVGEAAGVHDRVAAKLRREPVEDLRVDFEDGYGVHPDADEDAEAARAAGEVARAHAAGTLPPFVGLRIKPFEAGPRGRAIRTLDIFLTTLLDAGGGAVTLPDGFVVTFPKATAPAQVEVFADLLERLEGGLDLPAGALRFELQIETTQAVVDHTGAVAVPALIAAAGGRCTGLHFGTYDYTAAVGVTAAHQDLAHPACDFARHVMQAAAAGTGVRLSDGSTNVLPVGDTAAVHRAWRLHHGHVRRSLGNAFYQGWDLHPAQLVTRYAAVFAFFRADLEPSAARLRAWVGRTGEEGGGAVLDEPATARALAGYLVRGLDCGAVDAAEVAALTGVAPDALRGLLRPA